jgi:hypothetical protein
MAQQNEGMYKKARLLIYGENPVMAVAEFSQDDLILFNSYGLGMGWKFEGQRMLNEDDGLLLAFLCSNEFIRRKTETRDEFFLYLQERKEQIDKMPLDAKSGKELGWLLVLDTAVRTNQLNIGRK